MGRLARHVAEVAQSVQPELAVPGDLHPTIQRMSQEALDLVSTARAAIVTMDDTAARRLDHADDEIDGLHDGLYHQLLEGNWQHGTAAAVRTALIARYYERYADHAVSVARRVAFLGGKSDLDTSSGLTPSS
jgi:phosphate transport system protein